MCPYAVGCGITSTFPLHGERTTKTINLRLTGVDNPGSLRAGRRELFLYARLSTWLRFLKSPAAGGTCQLKRPLKQCTPGIV